VGTGEAGLGWNDEGAVAITARGVKKEKPKAKTNAGGPRHQSWNPWGIHRVSESGSKY
jgi:hypothetical protein